MSLEDPKQLWQIWGKENDSESGWAAGTRPSVLTDSGFPRVSQWHQIPQWHTGENNLVLRKYTTMSWNVSQPHFVLLFPDYVIGLLIFLFFIKLSIPSLEVGESAESRNHFHWWGLEGELQGNSLWTSYSRLTSESHQTYKAYRELMRWITEAL